MGNASRWRIAAMMVLLAMIALQAGGCASDPKNIDPWEGYNRFMYSVDDGLDKVLLKPSADLYVKVIPQPVRKCLGNAFDNAGYPNVIINDFLQANWLQGLSDSGRMAVNSTIGIAGLFDVAGPMGMVSHDNDIGITLGKWGLPPGPYLVLPLFGPSTVRDSPVYPFQIVTNPLTWVDMPIWGQVALGITIFLDGRSRAYQETLFRDQAAIDPYLFVRDAYLQYREAQIHPGKSTQDQSFYDEDMESTSQPATQPVPTTRQSAPATTGTKK